MRFCPSCGSRFTNDARYCPVDGQPTSELPDVAPKVDPLLGTIIDGRYQVEKGIGEGGMGVVYLATHVALQKRFALKVLRGEMARDQEVVQRFVQEAQASSSIGHPNIIDISDFGRLPDGSFYFVMEYLDGQSLTDLVASSGAIRASVAVPIIEMIASALSAAHECGIVHRDLKPDNILLVRRGQTPHFPKVLDFGIAKVGGAASKLTRTGMIFGTPHYMSPEQAAGQAVDKRTDIYALGVIMYQMVTGHVPFDADTFMGILSKHMFEAPVPPTSLLASAELGALEPVIMRALVKKPEQRYQSMGELMRDIATLRAGGRISVAPPPGALTLGLPSFVNARDPARGVTQASSATPSAGLHVGSVTPRHLVIGASLLLAVGAAVGGGVVVYRRATEARVPVPATFSFPVVAPHQAGSGIAASRSDVPAGVAPPTRTATIRLESEPAGATVYDGESIVGVTPLEIPRPSATTRLSLRMPQYRDAIVVVENDTVGPLGTSLSRASQLDTTSSGTTGAAHRVVVDHAPHPAHAEPGTQTVSPPAVPPRPHNPVQATPDVLDPWQ